MTDIPGAERTWNILGETVTGASMWVQRKPESSSCADSPSGMRRRNEPSDEPPSHPHSQSSSSSSSFSSSSEGVGSCSSGYSNSTSYVSFVHGLPSTSGHPKNGGKNSCPSSSPPVLASGMERTALAAVFLKESSGTEGFRTSATADLDSLSDALWYATRRLVRSSG